MISDGSLKKKKITPLIGVKTGIKRAINIAEKTNRNMLCLDGNRFRT